jgi:hypothetical protein
VPGETAAGPSKAGTLFKGLAEIGNAAFLGLLAGEIYKWAIGNNYKDPGVKIKSRGDETLYYNSNSQQFYVGIGQTNQKIDNAGAAKFLGVSENALIKFVTGATTQDPHHRGFAEGGAIGGNTAGQAVQVTAHTGEWILNAYQQMRLAAAGFGGNVRGLQSWLFGGPQAMPQPGRGGPTVKKTGGLTYALDTDAYGNTITFVELRDGTWGQIAVAPSGKAPLIPGNPSIASGRLHHRGRYQSLVDSLIKGGDIGLGTALGKKYGLGFDPTDYGRIAPAGSGPSGGFAAGGVVTGGNRAGGTTVVAHMPIYTQQVEADVDYIGQRMTMHLESAV